PLLDAGGRTVPYMGILWLPLLFGLRTMYIWTHPDVLAGDEALRQKELYLNLPFFLVRAVLYFAIWAAFSIALHRWRTRPSVDPPWGDRRLQGLSAAGLLLYVIPISFATIDWVMSLEPHWFSSIIGLLFVSGQGIASLAFVIAMAALVFDQMPFAKRITPN